jgi:Leucine-rich repeat (LRR) protein
MNRLTLLDLQGNQFTGSIPSEWWNLDRLEILNLGYNPLSVGSIPGAIQKLSGLFYLCLDATDVTGTIPLEVFELPNLGRLCCVYRMTVSGHVLTWCILTFCFAFVHVLLLSGWLDLRLNALEGPLPTKLARLHAKLEMLGLGGNRFTGTIPSEIALLTSLLELDLADNVFTGSIPEEIYFSGMKHLNALIVNENNLSGSISSTYQGLCC